MEGESVGSVESEDRLSMLPDDIRELILGYLPIGEAVRTGILSRKWMDSWTRVVQLNIVFDENLEKEMSIDRYCRLVGKMFLFHVGYIRKCVIRPLWYDFGDNMKGLEYLEGDMETWLQCLSRKGIEDLTIDFRKGDDVFDVGDDSTQNFELPRSIFRCLELSCLSLARFLLMSSVGLMGFPNLVKLELIETVIHEDSLEKIISFSPLETLIVIDCVLANRMTAISSRSLKIFKIVRTFNENFPFILKFVPNLRVASFIMDALEDDTCELFSNSLYIFRRVPKIEELSFDCRLLKTFYPPDIIPIKLPNPLVHLKTVTLHALNILSKDDLSFLFCIIRSSPNLQNLTICLKHNSQATSTSDSLKDVTASIEAEDIKEIKASITTLSVAFDCLDKGDYVGGHIALIDGLVSCSPNLEKLFIKSPPSFRASAGQQLTNAIPKFGQSSSKLKTIIHTKEVFCLPG